MPHGTQCPVPHVTQPLVSRQIAPPQIAPPQIAPPQIAPPARPARADWFARCQTIFYDRLFHDMPGARDLVDDERRQCRMFRTLIDIAFSPEKRGEKLRPALRHLGRHHNERGILSVHLKGGRAALIEAFSTVFADDADIDPAVLAAIYDRLVASMLDTAQTPGRDD